jgi:hypothetical protein
MEPRRTFNFGGNNEVGASAGAADAEFSGANVRGFNFPRWNRLHNFWSKDDMLRLMPDARRIPSAVIGNSEG